MAVSINLHDRDALAQNLWLENAGGQIGDGIDVYDASNCRVLDNYVEDGDIRFGEAGGSVAACSRNHVSSGDIIMSDVQNGEVHGNWVEQGDIRIEFTSRTNVIGNHVTSGHIRLQGDYYSAVLANVIGGQDDGTNSAAIVLTNSSYKATILGNAYKETSSPYDYGISIVNSSLVYAGGDAHGTSNDLLDATDFIYDPDGDLIINKPSTSTASERWSMPGVLTVKEGDHEITWDQDIEIISIEARVKVAPTGSAVIIDAHVNDTTTLYTTQGNRPTIATSAFTDTTTPDITAVTAGDPVRIDVDQIDSNAIATGLTVTVRYRGA